jgi:hypothetical protein
MDDDMNAAKMLKKKFEDKILLVRYEDLSFNPEHETLRILKFLGLECKKTIKDFLDTHTKGANNQSKYSTEILPVFYNTFRDSKLNAFAWRNKSNFTVIKQIQEVCSTPLKRFGYNLITDEKQLLDPKFEILKMTEDVQLLRQVSFPLSSGFEKIWTGIKTYFSSTKK